jgi:hypothetical protein
MKSLTEQQLRDLLKEAWEDGLIEGFDREWPFSSPPETILASREALFTKLIASV